MSADFGCPGCPQQEKEHPASTNEESCSYSQSPAPPSNMTTETTLVICGRNRATLELGQSLVVNLTLAIGVGRA
jgi:hypothetical protein